MAYEKTGNRSKLQEELLKNLDAAAHALVSSMDSLAKKIHTEAEVEIVDLHRSASGRPAAEEMFGQTVRCVRFGYIEMRMGESYFESICTKLPPFLGEKLKQMNEFDAQFLLSHVVEYSKLKSLLQRFINSAETESDLDFLSLIKTNLPPNITHYKKIEACTVNNAPANKKRLTGSLPEYAFEPPPSRPVIEGWGQACIDAGRIEVDAAVRLTPSVRSLREQVGALLGHSEKK